MVNCACLFSAICFVISNALGIAIIVKDALNPSYDMLALQSLDVNYIQNRWDHRRNIAPLIQTAHLFNMVAWLFLCVPMIQLAWALSRGGKRKVGIHAAIGAFTIAGVVTEVLSRLFLFGIWGSADWVSASFNLSNWFSNNDTIGWKTLELNFIIIDGMMDWIDAFEWICLFNILVLLYFSIGTQSNEQRVFSLWWIRLGLVIAFFCFVDFSADLLRLEEWQSFAQFAIFIAIVNTCFFLPIWLIWLAFTIRHVMPESSNSNETTHWSPGTATTTNSNGRALWEVHQDSTS